MDEKKIIRKYFVAQFIRKEIREFETEEEYANLIKTLKKYNNKSENQLLFSNIKKEYTYNGKIKATINMYMKVFDRNTLEQIDLYTTTLSNINDFIFCNTKFLNNNIYKPEILYFYPNKYYDENGKTNDYDIGAKTARLFFECDEKYLSKKAPLLVINRESEKNNVIFFIELEKTFRSYPNTKDACERCRKLIDFYKSNGYFLNKLSTAGENIYNHLVYEMKNGVFLKDKEKNKILNYKARRNFADFLSRCHQTGLIELFDEEIYGNTKKI